jgi:AMP nucleosidase
MKSKEEIVANWLPRYTGTPLESFGKYIILTNFGKYIKMFADWHGVEINGLDMPMPSATAKDITIINFTMGSANAATIMDLLTAIEPKAVLFLGKCGGLKKKNQLGDLILPIAAIRGEGTSNDYLLCLHLACKKPFLRLYVTTIKITGQVLYIPPTEGCGNMTKSSKSISERFVRWV